ncbi:DUF2963 domain-containing protein [Candidatus Phytoplasma pruni]|uniref:DUF2963 domain-containing protein n=1 Tax=Candidatus Phytoplasma pruni TaxID=479893 RepID=A0A851HJJ3_9MOLU|nr:DUF2963 domain-containing protein [Candidatus Phytoplasma pruni]NWN45609.1 DUF2963 domain-containing protein [Candidatus Phytoplasma pruni]
MMFYQTPRKLTSKTHQWGNQKYENEDDYKEDLKKWQNQCYIKPGEYKGRDIKNILYREDLILYDSEGNTHQYEYKKGFINDEWFLDNINLGTSMVLKDFQWQLDYLDTTPPPTKPEKMNVSDKNTLPNNSYQPPIKIFKGFFGLFYETEFNPNNGKMIKKTYYNIQDKQRNRVEEYDPENEKLTRTIYYNSDSSIEETIHR